MQSFSKLKHSIFCLIKNRRNSSPIHDCYFRNFRWKRRCSAFKNGSKRKIEQKIYLCACSENCYTHQTKDTSNIQLFDEKTVHCVITFHVQKSIFNCLHRPTCTLRFTLVIKYKSSVHLAFNKSLSLPTHIWLLFSSSSSILLPHSPIE